jgi:hypothetical protein
VQGCQHILLKVRIPTCLRPSACPDSTPPSCTSSAVARTCTWPPSWSSRAIRPPTTRCSRRSPDGCISSPATASASRSSPWTRGGPVWVDDPHFNLRYHVRHSAIPAPGSERELKRLAGRLFAQPLDRARPLWDVSLVEGPRAARGRHAAVRADHEDPPLAGRRRLGRGHRLRPLPGHAGRRAPAAGPAPRSRAAAVGRQAPGRRARRAHLPAAGDPAGRAPGDPRTAGGARAGRGARRARVRLAAGARHAAQRPDRPTPPLRLARRGPRARQAGQERLGRDDQRRDPHRGGARPRAASCASAGWTRATSS